ncbi:MAG: hypothetical protein ACOX66_08510 [Oscillospiraceae bacterium]|jgi:hypothetical protein
MNEKKHAPKKRADIYYQFYDFKSVASVDGMTGLIPSPPENDHERAAYAELEGTPVDLDDGD